MDEYYFLIHKQGKLVHRQPVGIPDSPKKKVEFVVICSVDNAPVHLIYLGSDFEAPQTIDHPGRKFFFYR